MQTGEPVLWEAARSPDSVSVSPSPPPTVFTNVGGPHRGRVVVPDARQHHHQRLHRSHAQGLECRDGRMYPHPLRAYLNSTLHAPTREKVGSRSAHQPVTALLQENVLWPFSNRNWVLYKSTDPILISVSVSILKTILVWFFVTMWQIRKSRSI